MHASAITDLVQQHRLVGIVRLDDLSKAVELSRALLDGGILIQEFTLTNPDALAVIRDLLAKIPEFSTGRAAIGVGSVRTTAEANQALASGAQYVVTPTTQPEIIEICRAAKIPIMPGAYTPTEIATAWQCGASFVKVFPARNLGPAYIKDVLAPMPYLKLMPTGGIDLDNMSSYFKSGAAAVGVGGNLIDASAVKSGNWDQVARTARQYAQAAHG